MKTLTELSGILIRKAAAAVAQARASLPASVTAEASPAAAPSPEPPGEGTPKVAEAPPASPPPVDEPPESEAQKAALDAAVTEATGLSGERLARLRDAVRAAGRQVEDVRLVRVFGPEEPVHGAKVLNGFQYLVDVAPASMRQDGASPKKERSGRGGDRGRGGGGKGAPASGGFSMDSVKEDRKAQRGHSRGRGKPGAGQPR